MAPRRADSVYSISVFGASKAFSSSLCEAGEEHGRYLPRERLYAGNQGRKTERQGRRNRELRAFPFLPPQAARYTTSKMLPANMVSFVKKVISFFSSLYCLYIPTLILISLKLSVLRFVPINGAYIISRNVSKFGIHFVSQFSVRMYVLSTLKKCNFSILKS